MAVHLDRGIRERLHHRASSIASKARGLRVPSVDNIHVTLRFLGETDAELVPDLEDVMKAVAGHVPPFRIEVSGLGTFPPRGPARILWAAIGEGKECLSLLARQLEQEVERLGFPAERKPFHPHVTIGRIKDPASGRHVASLCRPPAAPSRTGEENSRPTSSREDEETFGSQAVEAIVLVQSQLRPAGPHYSDLAVVSLVRPPDAGTGIRPRVFQPERTASAINQKGGSA